MKRGFFFSESESQKMINCEHVIVQRVISLFFGYILTAIAIKCAQDCRNHVRDISGTFQETIVQGICR